MAPVFNNIVGHRKQLEMLSDDLRRNQLAHAYLLAGPADLGKLAIAKAFALAIQTEGLNEEEAYQLRALIDKGVHADTLLLQAGPEAESIKIVDIRNVMMNLQMTGDSRRRILVVEDIDRMTIEASNAMLKILEEPPSKVMFIFTSSNPKALLETILSRVRRLDFQLMSNQDMFSALKNRYRLAEEKKIYRVLELAQGRIAKAIKLMETSEHFQAYEDIYQQIKNFLANHDVAAAFSLIAQIHPDPLLVQIFLEIAFMVFREDLKVATANADREAQRIVTVKLDKLMEVKKLSETNVNSRLLLENFILNL